MNYEWDEHKRHSNAAKHGVDFADAEAFDWETAVVAPDLRKNYGEPRHIALGRIGRRVYVLIFTLRGETVRIISLRKANQQEVARYEEAAK